MGATLDRIDKGEEVMIRRRHRAYMVIPVNKTSEVLSGKKKKESSIPPYIFPEPTRSDLDALIEKVKEESSNGETVTVHSHKELNQWLESL